MYIGEFKNNNKEGYGMLKYINGNKYEDEQKNDAINGYVIFTFNNVEKYE